MKRSIAILIPALVLITSGCFRGADREKEAPPGVPGGLCLAPDGHCEDGQCNKQANYCFDPTDPCRGFFCGGSDRGICMPNNQGEPTCMCAQTFENRTFTLYCCPEDGSDPNCVGGQMPGDGGADS